MMIIQRVITILLSLILNGYGSAIFAATSETIGTVISVEGKAAAINQANQQRALERRSEVYLHDRIVTQPESKVQLILRDDSVIVVQSSTEFYVSEFAFNNNAPRNNKYVGNIIKGALINLSGRGETTNYHLDSPLATIAFRGTGLATRLITKNNVLVNQEINVFQGYVTVTNKCENIGAGCKPFHIDIGTGQKFNAATVNVLGGIKGVVDLVIAKKDEISAAAGQLIKALGGITGVNITCKGH